MELKKLVEYIDVGQTADAIELGLNSKFQLECINHHLLTRCGLVLLKVRVMEASKTCVRGVCTLGYGGVNRCVNRCVYTVLFLMVTCGIDACKYS